MTDNRPRVRFRVRRATEDVPVTKDTETKAPVCPLCGGPGPFRISHIIPKFAFEWLKDTSATGFMRHGPHPNLRVQDGFKKELLCDSCEQLLAGWEDAVAAQLFRPYNEGSKVTITYEEWLAKFAASLVWRVLFVMKAEGLKNLSDSQLRLADLALEVWRKFIRGERDNPGSFELHLLPVDFVDASKNNSLPANFNRYLTRSIEMDIVAKKGSAFVYAKMGKLVFIGIIEQPISRQWFGSRLAIKKGTVKPSKYTAPAAFLDYLTSRASRMNEIMQQLSPKQQAKITETMKKNIDKAAESETFKAMTYDIAMFGIDAVAEQAGEDAKDDAKTETTPKS
jgi:hypothetical protein